MITRLTCTTFSPFPPVSAPVDSPQQLPAAARGGQYVTVRQPLSPAVSAAVLWCRWGLGYPLRYLGRGNRRCRSRQSPTTAPGSGSNAAFSSYEICGSHPGEIVALFLQLCSAFPAGASLVQWKPFFRQSAARGHVPHTVKFNLNPVNPPSTISRLFLSDTQPFVYVGGVSCLWRVLLRRWQRCHPPHLLAAEPAPKAFIFLIHK